MINIISKNYNTNYCVFAVDSVSELDKLPTVTSRGKDNLATISSCTAGSRAIVTETSDRYILNGIQNKWIMDKNSSWSTSVSVASNEDILNMTNDFLS